MSVPRVDPVVRQIAEMYVDDLLIEVNATKRIVLRVERDAWVDRTASALQQAVEQEIEDIKEALIAEERDYADVVDSGSPGDPGLRRDR